MLTEKSINKGIVNFFKVEDNIDKWGKIKKHSNVCWEYYKYDESLSTYKMLMTIFLPYFQQKKLTEASLPFRKNIMNYQFKRLVICENKDTGINLMKRYNMDLFNMDIEYITIDKKQYYIIW